MTVKTSIQRGEITVSPGIAAIMMIGHSIRETYIIRNIPETHIKKEQEVRKKK